MVGYSIQNSRITIVTPLSDVSNSVTLSFPLLVRLYDGGIPISLIVPDQTFRETTVRFLEPGKDIYYPSVIYRNSSLLSLNTESSDEVVPHLLIILLPGWVSIPLVDFSTTLEGYSLHVGLDYHVSSLSHVSPGSSPTSREQKTPRGTGEEK